MTHTTTNTSNENFKDWQIWRYPTLNFCGSNWVWGNWWPVCVGRPSWSRAEKKSQVKSRTQEERRGRTRKRAANTWWFMMALRHWTPTWMSSTASANPSLEWDCFIFLMTDDADMPRNELLLGMADGNVDECAESCSRLELITSDLKRVRRDSKRLKGVGSSIEQQSC